MTASAPEQLSRSPLQTLRYAAFFSSPSSTEDTSFALSRGRTQGGGAMTRCGHFALDLFPPPDGRTVNAVRAEQMSRRQAGMSRVFPTPGKVLTGSRDGYIPASNIFY